MTERVEKIIHRDFWNNHKVEVIDQADFRSLYFGSSYLQSRMSLSVPHALVLSYTHFMMLGLLLTGPPKNILIIGVGSGSLIRFLNHYFGTSTIDAVDYSEHIIKLAKGYFHLPSSTRISVHCLDGYQFMVNNKDKHYDMILVDAFDGEGMAPTIYHESFFRLCRNSLREKGVATFNMWSSDKAEFRILKKQLVDTFESGLFAPVPQRGNVIYIGTRDKDPLDRLQFSKKELRSFSHKFHLDFIKMVKIARQNNSKLGDRIRQIFS